MNQPDYTDITQIIELQTMDEVNEHLARGWRLLSVRTERGTDDQQRTIYVLGLPRPGSVTTLPPPRHVAPPSPITPPAPHSTPATSRSGADQSDQPATGTPARRGRSARPTAPPEPPPRPITLVTRLVISEDKPTKRRRKETPPPPPRKLSEEEQRVAAGWEQVKETGKPVLVDDKLLIPGEMSPWDAIEHLPDGLREQTRTAMQQKVAGVITHLIERMRERLRTELGDEDQRAEFRTQPYAVQMAMAETMVRHQMGWAEVPMKDLLRRYGAVLEEELKKNHDQAKRTED
jgi:hypothetical protein